MSTTAVRIVLDTNVFISIIGKTSLNRWLFDKIIEGRFILCISQEIMLEYEEVLARKTTSEIAQNVSQFLAAFPFVEKTEIFFNWTLVEKDPDDNKFIDCAVAAGAFCIVSNDRHLQPFKTLEFPPLRVLTLDEFEVQFREG
jgi:uncharacterized protein